MIDLSSYQRRSGLPSSWTAVCLALLPGLTMVVIRAVAWGNSSKIDVWVGLLCSLLVLISLLWRRRLAVWTLPAGGLLLSTGPAVLLGLLFPGSGLRPPLFDSLVNTSVVCSLLAAVYLIWHHRKQVTVSTMTWIILVLFLLSSVVQPGFIPSLLLFMGLPLAAVLPFIRCYGPAAGLLALGGIFWTCDSLWDPSYFLPAGAGMAVELILPAAFLLIAPLSLLRARTVRGQFLGLVLPPVVALLLCEMIRIVTYPPGYSPELWQSRGMGLLQIVLLILLAALIYRRASPTSQTLALPPFPS